MIDLSQSVTRWPMHIKAKRAIWTFLLEPLVRWLPKPFSPCRSFALRIMGATIGPHCLILPGVKVLMPWNLHLADHVAIGEYVNIYNFAPVTIGRMTVVSQYCYLCTGTHDYTLGDMPLTYAPIVVGEQCWVAAGVFLAPGVSIPDGVVVGAMSVVNKSLPTAWAVYAGNPCRMVKARVMRKRM
jgi:putative colanic acid biosynthesis acetyltransferase WcaF